MRIGLLFTAVVFVASCGPELPAPKLETVTPNWAYNGEITEIDIVGENLFPYVVVSEGPNDASRFDAQYRAWLQNDQEQYELTGVTLTDYGTLSALIGTGLEPGEYSLSLVSPDGDESVNSVPFVVTDSRADHLDIYTEHVVYEVNDYAVVYLSVLDADDRLVESALPVEFVVNSANDATGVIFQDGGLTGFSLLDDGVGVSGTLGADGRGYVVLTSTLPDELQISIEVNGQSVVIGDDGNLVFGTGAVEQVLLELPSDPFNTTAGEQFSVLVTLLDRFGNVVENRPADLWLHETCGTYMAHMPVVGQRVVQLGVSGATGQGCEENKIVATGDVVGESNGFLVDPAQPLGFLIDDLNQNLDNGFVVAGELLAFDLYPIDSFGNISEVLGQSVTIFDDKNSAGAAECNPETGPTRWNCEVRMEVASTEVTLTFEDDTGVTADTASFSVLPAEPSTLGVASATAVVAGDAFEMLVAVYDVFSNIIEVDQSVDPFSFGGTNLSEISCVWDSVDSGGLNIFVCREFVANAGTVFSVNNTNLFVSGSSDVVEIVNSDLSTVDVSFSDSSITAGDSTVISIAAFDIWGNPYLVQADANIDISDGLGGLSPTTGTLSANGDLVMTVSLELAGEPVVVEVSQSSNVLGSGSVVVGHGLADSISVKASETWGWVGETTEVSATVIDVFGNPVTSYSETVTLFGAPDQFDEVEISDFFGGVGKSEMLWLDSGLGISILADGDGILGGSTLFDVLHADCAQPPLPVLVFAGSGDSSEVLCLNSGVAASTADFSSSTPGGSALYSYHLLVGDNYLKRTTAPSQSLQLKNEGYGQAILVVADEAACGGIGYGEVAVGLDDGSPAGEVVAVLSSSSLVAGSNTNGQATVSVEAFDCAGDVASNGAVVVRSNLGDVDPTLLSLVESGEGLMLTLDNSGAGSFVYNVENSDMGGDANISIGTTSHAAYGGIALTVSGDDRQPRVSWQTPIGTHLDIIDQVVVQMNESILSATITESSFLLTDSTGGTVPSSIAWDASSFTVTITPDNVLDGSADSYSLKVFGTVRDDNGNFLDGTYTSDATGSAWITEFGAVTDEGISLLSCSAPSEMFYPDGDESGSLSQQDSVSVNLESSQVGTTVVLEVYSASGDLVLVQREPILTITPSIEWNGKDESGVIQDAGLWTLETFVEDISGNPSDVCSIDVALRQNIMDY